MVKVLAWAAFAAENVARTEKWKSLKSNKGRVA